MAKEERSSVDKLKSRLYARGVKEPGPQERSTMTQSSIHAPTSWAEVHSLEEGEEVGAAKPESPMPSTAMPMTPPTHKKRISLATKFFLGSIGFFIIAAGISALLFYGGVNTTSPQNIDIQVVAPSLIDGGKEATFGIIITNRNTTQLEVADLVIDYPDGARSAADPTKTLSHERITIGTIQSGEQVKRTVSALLYGQEGAQQTITARLEYSVAGSVAVFEKSSEATLTIGSAPVSLSITAPSKAIAGNEFTMDIVARSNATLPVEYVVIEGQYPVGFTVTHADPQGAAGNTIWRLGTMAPGKSKTIHITGSIEASDGDERVFKFLAGTNSDTTDAHVKVPFLTIPQTLTVERPFITGTLTVDGKVGQNIAVSAGKTLQGTVQWQNNLTDAVSDVELTLSFSGPAIDKNSISSQNGFYQSGNTSIIWTHDQESTLAKVPPGGSGIFQFSFATLPPGAQGTLITNPTITLNLNVKATRQGDGGAPEVVASAASAKLTLASQFSVAASSMHSSGLFANTGPIPPRVEQNTSYTITWTVKNSANTVANTNVQAILPPYVSFITAQQGSTVTYDAGSRTVRWSLGDLKAGVGYTTTAQQASFQVSLMPSVSQVGSIPSLTGTTLMSGQDRFAQVQVNASADGPTTHTTDGGSGMDIVLPKQ